MPDNYHEKGPEMPAKKKAKKAAKARDLKPPKNPRGGAVSAQPASITTRGVFGNPPGTDIFGNPPG